MIDFPNNPVLDEVYTDPTTLQRFRWDGTAWIALREPLSTISDSPPSNPAPGDTWYDSDSGVFFFYYDDGSSAQWVSVVPYVVSGDGNWASDGANVYFTGGNVGIGTSTPNVSLDVVGTDAVQFPAGTTGERPTGANGMIRYNTTDSQFEGYAGGAWGAIAGGGGGGGVTNSDTAPGSPADGDLWYKTDTLVLYVYYDDGSSAQWVSVGGGEPENGFAQITGTPVNNQLAVWTSDNSIEGEANLVFDTIDDRLGIGTSTPGDAIHILNTDAAIRLEDSDAPNNGYAILRTNANGSLVFAADAANNEVSSTIIFDIDGSEQMRIGANGFVGINQNSPNNAFLEIKSASQVDDEMLRLIADLPVTGERTLTISSPPVDSFTSPFVIETFNAIEFSIDGNSVLNLTDDSSVTMLNGSVQTNLRTGVANSFLHYDQTTPQIQDSVNIASVTDTAAGNYDPTFTNNQAGALLYYVTEASEAAQKRASITFTTAYGFITEDDTGSNVDSGRNFDAVHGELA